MSEERIRKDHFTIREVNIMFIILATVFLTFGAYVQNREVISGLLITEFGILFIPPLVYAAVTKKDIKRTFRLKRLPLQVIWRIVLMAFLLLPTVAVANLITIFFIEMFSSTILPPIPTAQTSMEFIVLFLVIAGSAGLCEEFFFRGPILNGYEAEVGKKWAAVFSGLLFGIFHFNPQNILGPIILGIVFAYLVQITGSIFAGVIAHMTNNGIAVTAGYFINQFDQSLDLPVDQTEKMFESTGAIAAAIGIYAVIAVVCLLGIKEILKQIKRLYPVFDESTRINVSGKVYQVIKTEEEAIFLRPSDADLNEGSPMMATDLQRLKEVKAKIDYSVWDRRPLNMNFGQWLPIIITVIFYVYLVYIAFFRGV